MPVLGNLQSVKIKRQFDDYYAQFMFLRLRGKYGTQDPNITPDNFPGEYLGDFDAVPVHFDREIHFDAAVLRIQQMKLRPATMIELLAFGAIFPEEQRKYSIIAIGQTWKHPKQGPCVGSLPHFAGERELILYPVFLPIGQKCRFLAIREPNTQAA